QAAGGPFTGPSGRPFTGTAPRDPRGTASRGAAQRKRSGELHVAEQHVVGAVVDAERDQGGAARREHAGVEIELLPLLVEDAVRREEGDPLASAREPQLDALDGPDAVEGDPADAAPVDAQLLHRGRGV